jgi:hypothetical protein
MPNVLTLAGIVLANARPQPDAIAISHVMSMSPCQPRTYPGKLTLFVKSAGNSEP